MNKIMNKVEVKKKTINFHEFLNSLNANQENALMNIMLQRKGLKAKVKENYISFELLDTGIIEIQEKNFNSWVNYLRDKETLENPNTIYVEKEAF